MSCADVLRLEVLPVPVDVHPVGRHAGRVKLSSHDSLMPTGVNVFFPVYFFIFLSHTWYSRYWEYQQVGFFVVKFIVVVVKILTARDLYVPRTIPYKKNPRSGAYVVASGQAPP